jgi:Lipid A 3-O-deacylase (PagL)
MDNNGAAAIFAEAMGGERGIGLSTISLQPVASLGWIDGRNVARYDGSRYITQHDTEVLAGGARFHVGDQQAWYKQLFFGFELAYNQQATRALSSHYEFMSTLGWQGKRFSFQLRHISNGGIHDPNRGETMALVGIGFCP